MIQETQTVERITRLEAEVAALKTKVSHLSRRKAVDALTGEPVRPISDCTECGGSLHQTVNGTIVRCACYDDFQRRLDTYHRLVAQSQRRKKRNRPRI